MTSIGVRQLKEELITMIRRAEAGERIVVTRDGRPVAVLVPMKDLPIETPTAVLERMVAKGLLTHVPAPFSFEGLPDPVEIRGEALSETVIRERRESRY